jgi:sugar/nucleoside kinase (ribokinase family)
MEARLLVVGGVGVDTVVRVESLPAPVRDSTLVPPVRDYVGHTGNGVALGAHHLGIPTQFIDFLGDDPQGSLVRARYRQTGLAFACLTHPSGTRRSVNFVDASGRRASFYDGRHPFDLRMPRAFYLPFLEASTHCHISIMNWARFLYDDALGLGRTTSTDLHDWDGQNGYHQDFACRSDLVFLSTAALRDGHEAVMHGLLERGRARVVVATAGADGGFWLERGEHVVRRFSACPPDRPVVDTNGAGDAFVVGFLHGWFRDRPIAECVLLGALAGAYACTCPGTHEAFISPAELQARGGLSLRTAPA